MEMVRKHSGAAAGPLAGCSEKPSYETPVREEQPRADLPVCSACGKGLTRSLSTAGKCPVCHNAICFRCWASGRRQRLCPDFPYRRVILRSIDIAQSYEESVFSG